MAAILYPPIPPRGHSEEKRGTYRFVLSGPFGGNHVTSGEYREIVPNKRIVKTWNVEGNNPVVAP